jgi:hypothetical protein
MDKTDKVLKQLSRKVETHADVASVGSESFILPNVSGRRTQMSLASCKWVEDGGVLYLYNAANTAILSIDLTTGNVTLGGSQKRLICTKVVGV